MRTTFFLFLFLLSIQLVAQEENTPFDIRFGVGTSLLGSGDMITTSFENELNYKLTQYIATGVSVNYGRSNFGISETASYLQGNLNVYFSPFKNTRRNDFRIGAGLSYINVSDAYLTSVRYHPTVDLTVRDYEFDKRNSYGYSIILENTYSITNRFLLGLKVYTQPYFNGDINSGVMLKFGVKL